MQNLKISLNCKLDSAGAYGFIKPIADIAQISQIDVFRDSEALKCEKVNYHSSFQNKNGFLGQLSKFFKMLRIIKPDYELCIGIYEIPHGLLAFFVGKLKNIPVVISIIGNPGYTKLRKGLRKKITYFMYKRIHAITVTGSKSKQVLIDNGISKEKIYILPNSIDVQQFVPNISIEKKYDIISLGRLSPEKKLDNILKIGVKLKKTNPKIRIGIAGKGPEMEFIKSQIEKLDLKENVHVLGYVDDIIEFYNQGKLFVLTSRTEGLPRTVIEAMACGVPCVASNVGDMQDIIDNGIDGFLIDDYDDLNSFATEINKMLKNNKAYYNFSKKAVAKSRQKFSYNAATAVWEEIISKLETKI